MAQVTITINSREYAVACEDGQEVHIIQLSRMLDEKAKMLTHGGQQVNENMLLAMVGLLLADEVEELRKGAPVQNVGTASEEDLHRIDVELAKTINNLSGSLKSVAKKIESL